MVLLPVQMHFAQCFLLSCLDGQICAHLTAKGLLCQKPDPVKRNFALKVSDISHLRACAQIIPSSEGDISALCTAPIISLLASSSGDFSGQNLGCLALSLKCWLLPASVGILHLCCDILLGLAVFDHSRYWQTCPECQEQVPENSKSWKWSVEGEFANCCGFFTFCSSGIWRNTYSWTLNNEVNYPVQIDQTCCPDPCCSHSVLIAPAIKNSESQRRALHLFRKMLLNSPTQQIPLLE